MAETVANNFYLHSAASKVSMSDDLGSHISSFIDLG